MSENNKFTLPRWENIPNIDLYLDQVIMLIDEYLSPFIHHDPSEPILTKTMVNNYVKNKIIEPPQNKKYSKNSVCCLIAICILKSVYSMNEISILLKTGFKIGEDRVTYTRFCDAVDKAIECAFKGVPFTDDTSPSGYPYLLQNIAQSFAGKVYTQEYCYTRSETYLKS